MKAILILVLMRMIVSALCAQDPGMEVIGKMSVQLIFATNEDAGAAGDLAKALPAGAEKELHAIAKLDFKEYRLLGGDSPDILKGYENWATPLRPSKEILVSFQPIKRNGGDRIQMVLEYWQSKRKIFSVNPTLVKGKTLYLLGPNWRKGRLVLAVKIEHLK